MHNAPAPKSRVAKQLSAPVATANGRAIAAGATARVALLAVLAAAVWGWIGVAHSLSESLWLDELHSAWSASAPLGEVSSRAVRGNQLSPYFWLLWGLSQTFGNTEPVLRAPSIAAWLAAVALSGATLARLATCSGQRIVLAALALVVCDRAQIFYATEARPYALLSLVALAAWYALAQWTEAAQWTEVRCAGSGTRDRPPLGVGQTWFFWWLGWCGLNVAAFWLQPTALLSIAAQFVYLLALSAFGGRLRLRSLARAPGYQGRLGLWPVVAGGAILGVAMLPALRALSPVWEHRQQWAGFAAKCGWRELADLLPLEACLMPLLAGVVLAAIAGAWGQRVTLANTPIASLWACHPVSASDPVSARHSYGLWHRAWWMWLCAWSVPCCLVLVLTASGVAPLMHRRYVFVAAFPFVIWLAHSWALLPHAWLRSRARSS